MSFFTQRLSFSDEKFCIQVFKSINAFFDKAQSDKTVPFNDLNLETITQHINIIQDPLSKELRNKILIFDPTNPRGRYLIHKCADLFPYVSSVSIGTDELRRVIVFVPSSNKKFNFYKEKKDMSSSPRNTARRPDKAIYVPKHRRNGSPLPELPKDCQNKTEKKKTSKDKENSCNDIEKTEDEKEIQESDLKGFCQKLDELKLSKNKEKAHLILVNCAQCVSERFAKEIIENSLMFLREHPSSMENALHIKSSHQVQMQQNLAQAQLQQNIPQAQLQQNIPQAQVQQRVLPGMATNCVNLAIENAMQLLKAVKTYEKRKQIPKQKETIPIDPTACESTPEILANDQKPKTPMDDQQINSDKKQPVEIKNEKENKNTKQIASRKNKVKGKSKKEETENAPSNDDKSLKKTKKATKEKKSKKQPNQTRKSVLEKKDEVTDLVENKEELKKEEEEEELGDDWDSKWTDDGECLSETMMDELSSLTDIKDACLEKAEGIDYLNFTPTKNIQLDEGEFGHILELHDFSPYLETKDIFNSLSAAGIKDYNLTWVDDTHILAVFASQAAAHSAMKMYVPVLQMRQVTNASRASKSKARDLRDSLLPYKKRPESTGMVARNMVAGALGIRTNVSKEQRLKEKELIKEARDKRRRKKQDQRDIWENPD